MGVGFGDGQSFSQQNPGSHIYTSIGTFTARLTVTNASGTDFTTRTISTTIACAAPQAIFSVNPTSGVKNSTQFDVTDASTNMGTAGCNNQWTWDFGDGAGSVLQDPPNHVYSKKGMYTVQLTVSNLAVATVRATR